MLYLHRELDFSDHTSVAIFSYFSACAYFSPLLGGYISDSYLGKYRTILIFIIVYFIGSVVLALSAFGPYSWGAFLGLGLIALGTVRVAPRPTTAPRGIVGSHQTPSSQPGRHQAMCQCVWRRSVGR